MTGGSTIPGLNHSAPREKQDIAYKDHTLMPFGKHKGTPLVAVPADYLLWLHKEHCSDMLLRAYIEDNMDALMQETKRNKRY